MKVETRRIPLRSEWYTGPPDANDEDSNEEAELFKLLLTTRHMYTYMAEYVFEPRRIQRWASFAQPGLHTLSNVSTQRVEATNSALKTAMDRSGSMDDVHDAIVGKVQDDANKSLRQTAGGAV
ncbi:unnamed protein product [Ectocarpus sp. CCAP 1310/34]|nr:unnamed protein product [Ectocarpus sp. CCAP 1310/34]